MIQLSGIIKELTTAGMSLFEIRLVIISVIMTSVFITLTPLLIVIAKRRSPRKCNTSNLNNHYFFQLVEFTVKVKIDQFDFNCTFKNSVFRELLKRKCTILAGLMRNLVAEADNISDIKKSFFDVIIFSKKELEDSFNSLFTRIGEQYVTIENKKIPVKDYVFERFITEWDGTNSEALRLNFEKIANAGIYDTVQERLEAALNICTSEIELINMKVESGLREVNGLFKSIKL